MDILGISSDAELQLSVEQQDIVRRLNFLLTTVSESVSKAQLPPSHKALQKIDTLRENIMKVLNNIQNGESDYMGMETMKDLENQAQQIIFLLPETKITIQ